MSKTLAWSVTELHSALCRPGADLSSRAPRVVDGSTAPTGIIIQDHRDMFVNFTLTVSRLSSSSPLSFSPGCGGEVDRVKIKDCVKIERVFFAIVAFPD